MYLNCKKQLLTYKTLAKNKKRLKYNTKYEILSQITVVKI